MKESIAIALAVTVIACSDAEEHAAGSGGATNATSNATSGVGGGGGAPPKTECTDNCRYVRAGSSGDGSDWSNALGELPETLERGLVYFVATGTYPGYVFDDPGREIIRVLRATEYDHGTDVGWNASDADGVAELGPVSIEAAYVELDGRDAMRIVGTFQSTVVAIDAPNVTLRGCDVDGNFQEMGGMHSDGACTGMTVSGDGVVVAGCRIHDAADDGVAIGGSSGVSFSGNVIHALHGCGTDGGCGPCYNGHSDGLEIYSLKDSEIVGNLIYDVASTAALFFGNWADELGNGPSEYCENVLLANNLMYSPDTGFVAYIEDARGVRVLHNVFWGLHQGAYGGLSIGQNVDDLDLYNNAILSINYTHIGGSYDAAEHRGDYNLFGVALGQWPEQAHDVVASDAGFAAISNVDGPAVADPAPADFAPAAQSPLIDAGFPGDATIVIPPNDFFGEPRDDTPNIGAIE